MEVIEGYRKTEIGIIPEDWELIIHDDLNNTAQFVQNRIGFPP